jgi:hypothetical protein
MKHSYHVITPLRRFENLDPLIKMLDPMGILWDVVVDSDLGWFPHFKQSWITTWVCPNEKVEFWNRCNFAINWLLDLNMANPLSECYRICILNDDDAYEPDFFKKVDEHDGELIITSMLRGHHIPAGVCPERAHGTNQLVAAPENMHPGQVGVEQAVICGRLLRHARLPYHIMGDGQMIEWLVQNHPATYVPDANVWFNYFEPGRWDK